MEKKQPKDGTIGVTKSTSDRREKEKDYVICHCISSAYANAFIKYVLKKIHMELRRKSKGQVEMGKLVLNIMSLKISMKFQSRNFQLKIMQVYMEYYSAIKKNSFESVLMRWMKLEPIIQSEVSQKDKLQYTNTYIWNLERW